MTSFVEARQFLLDRHEDYAAAYAGFRWPDPVPFNWALDWFDRLAADPATADRPALWIVDTATDRETRTSFAQLSRRSNQTANWLRSLGVRRGDRILLPLGNVAPLWETMLAAIKLGAVVIPATTLLPEADLADRIRRGNVKAVVTAADQVAKFRNQDRVLKIAVGATSEPGWHAYDPSPASTIYAADRETKPDDPLLLYFTSGTTARPKLVLHSHRSYPVGHLSTMYWLGLRPADVHLNISSPGWAKHAWSSFFAPWNAGATIVVVNQPRFEAKSLLDAVVRVGVTTLCAPPTVWRLLVQHDLSQWQTGIRELASAGEPLNPEVIERVRKAWGITIRDGYGQTETSCQIGNPPGQRIKDGSMGRPMPGYRPQLLTPDGETTEEGEICLSTTTDRPAGLMQGYDTGEPGAPLKPLGEVYRTGDVAMRDKDGYLTFVGRADDVFKSSDYRISPFELESVLIEHPAVAEAGVIPAPDPIRLSVPKAFIALVPGKVASRDLALDVFRHLRKELAPFKRVRRIEFVKDLPKTISGKIRRVQLRAAEVGKDDSGWERGLEFVEDDFPELKQAAGARDEGVAS
jgi:acetyl-CoA synthetase